MYYQSKAEIEEQIAQAGEQAVFEANCGELHEELVKILGRLRFRTSYGQNVLKHSLEVVHLAGIMAAELGREREDREARGAPARPRQGDDARGRGLARADLGADTRGATASRRRVVPRDRGPPLRRRAADGRGGAPDRRRRDLASRPGARGESLEHYIKRLEALEEIAARSTRASSSSTRCRPAARSASW